MTNTHDATRRTGAPSSPPDDADRLLDDGLTSPEEGADTLAEETGLDLSEASGLDADNVPADEESSRTLHAPD